MISKIINKNLQYNLLSLLNVFIGFLFIVILGRKFGAGKETDTYFLSVVIITYLGYFVQGVWEAMSPYYVEAKLESKKKASRLYSILMNDLILVAIIIVVLYFMITSIFHLINEELKSFLNIFIFYLVFQNILFLNKTILNLEHFYASFYLVDIFVFSVLLITVLMFSDIKYVAFGSVFATLLANIWQFYLIFKKVGLSYEFKFYDKEIKKVYINSFKLKLGSLFYGVKDIIIASIFTSFGEGVYSLFSYANKFAGLILQVVNAPIVNIFATKASYLIANKQHHKLRENIKKVLTQTTLLFSLSSSIVYFLIPYILNILFGEKFSISDINTIQKIFLVMVLFYLIVVIESPFARFIAIVKNFNYGLLLNFIFAVLLAIVFILFKIYHFNYIEFLYLLILVQVSNLVLAYKNYKNFLRIKNEI